MACATKREAKPAWLTDVTYVFPAASRGQGSWAAQVEPNLKLLVNPERAHHPT